MENLVKLLIGSVIALVGLFFYERTKRKASDSLIKNLDMRSDLLKDDANLEINKQKLKAEENNRKIIEEEHNKKASTKISQEEMEAFFNKKKNEE